MTRLNFLLFVALLASCLALVDSVYASRRVFTQLDRAKSEARQLEVEYQRLQVERQAQATPMRVEKTAREKLAMRTATPAVTQYVNDGAASAPASRPQGTAGSSPVSVASSAGAGREAASSAAHATEATP